MKSVPKCSSAKFTLLLVVIPCVFTSATSLFGIPASVEGPGGKGLPESFSKYSDSDGPSIAAASEMTRPGETLVASGHNLGGAKLRVWAEGALVDLEPLLSENDRIAAVLPESLPETTMLIWPVRGDATGKPFRINGATLWWMWPQSLEAESGQRSIRVLGKNLQMPGASPLVVIEGEDGSREVIVAESNPYELKVEVASLKAGDYRIWAHNGTGGRHGWSEAISFRVTDVSQVVGDAEVNVTDFGAIADDGLDDYPAVAAALDALRASGGGTLTFPEGRFVLSRELVVDQPHTRIQGTGSGEILDNGAGVTGGTVLSSINVSDVLPAVLRIRGEGVHVRSMAIINGHDGNDRNALVVEARNAVLQDLQVIFHDARDWGYANPGPFGKPGEKRNSGPYELGYIDDGAVFVNTEGPAQLLFIDSEVHAAGPGLQVGRFGGWHTMVSQQPSESIWVSGVDFRGHYAGEPDGESKPGASGRATGIVVYSGREIGVKNCTFAGADRSNRRIMGRTMLVFNTSSRDLYCAENESLAVGPHPSAEGMDSNQGEQYLIHYRYPYGGLFEVEAADAESLQVSTADIEPFPAEPDPEARWDLRRAHFHFNTKGSRVLNEVGQDGNWILFISAGKGVGQFREISERFSEGDWHIFNVRRPWRVVPDETSRVNLMPAYRHIVLYKNHVDTGELLETHKTHGVTFWFDSFDNIVDGNTFRNLTSGIIFNSRFRAPTGWNTTRDNVVENIAGYPGDTSEKAAGYVDHTRVVVQWPKSEDRVWYQVGNVARNNVIRNSEVGVYLHTRYTGLVRYGKPEPVSHPDGGIVLSVVEGNRIEDVREGIVLSSPVNAAVIRDNRIDAPRMSLPPIFSQDPTESVIDTVLTGNRFNGQPVTNLAAVKHDGEDRPGNTGASQSPSSEEANEIETLPPADGASRLFLREGALEIPGGKADPAYRAPAATLRKHQPDIVTSSPSMYIGTHEAGGELQANRGLFSFSLAPLRDYLDRTGGRVERAYLLLTTATGNESFPGSSTFHLHRSDSFEEGIATWESPGSGSDVGGSVGERLTSIAVSPEQAATVGAPVFFGGKPLANAVVDALQEGDGGVYFLVKRGNEQDSRAAGYFFRPGDNSHTHSSGHLEWRPTLVVDVAGE